MENELRTKIKISDAMAFMLQTVMMSEITEAPSNQPFCA